MFLYRVPERFVLAERAWSVFGFDNRQLRCINTLLPSAASKLLQQRPAVYLYLPRFYKTVESINRK